MKIASIAFLFPVWIPGVGHQSDFLADKHKKTKARLVKVANVTGEFISLTAEGKPPVFVPASLCVFTFEDGTRFTADESSAIPVLTVRAPKGTDADEKTLASAMEQKGKGGK